MELSRLAFLRASEADKTHPTRKWDPPHAQRPLCTQSHLDNNPRGVSKGDHKHNRYALGTAPMVPRTCKNPVSHSDNAKKMDDTCSLQRQRPRLDFLPGALTPLLSRIGHA